MSVAAVARAAGHDIRIVDRNIAPFTLRGIVDFRPEVVGISSLTGPMLEDAILVSKSVKKMFGGDVPVVWGGMHATMLPAQVLNDHFVDFAVVGEGEFTFLELLEALENGGSYSRILGLAYKEDGTAKVAAARPPIDILDSLPALPWEMVDAPLYFRNDIALFTSRGCPNRCAYCYNSKFTGKKWRAQSPDRVLRDLELAARYARTKSIKLFDDNFPTDRLRCLRILREIPSDYSLFVEASPNFIDDEFLHAVSRLRKVWLFIGLESGSRRMLEKMGRRVSVEDIRRAFALIRKHDNIRTIGNLVAGCPSETEEDFAESIELIREVNPTRYNVNIYIPYPGSVFSDELVQHGYEAPNSTEGWARLTAPQAQKDGISPDIGPCARLRRTIRWRSYWGQMMSVRNAALAGEFRFLFWRLVDFRFFAQCATAWVDPLRDLVRRGVSSSSTPGSTKWPT